MRIDGILIPTEEDIHNAMDWSGLVLYMTVCVWRDGRTYAAIQTRLPLTSRFRTFETTLTNPKEVYWALEQARRAALKNGGCLSRFESTLHAEVTFHTELSCWLDTLNLAEPLGDQPSKATRGGTPPGYKRKTLTTYIDDPCGDDVARDA